MSRASVLRPERRSRLSFVSLSAPPPPSLLRGPGPASWSVLRADLRVVAASEAERKYRLVFLPTNVRREHTNHHT